MSDEKLRFSVEESVWFEKGQEVSEMLSMSLDPDIEIQEHSQHVSIRGALKLSGDYRALTDTEDDRDAAFDDFNTRAVRVIDEVERNEDGTSRLEHRFPIDITVPKNRVRNLDDLYITIDTFDYDIPNRGCLKLEAELSISGISSAPTAEATVENAGNSPVQTAFDPPSFDNGLSESNREDVTTGQQSESTKKEEDALMEKNRPEEQEVLQGYGPEEEQDSGVSEEVATSSKENEEEEVFEAEVRKTEQLEEDEDQGKGESAAPQLEMNIRSERDKIINFTTDKSEDGSADSEEEAALDAEAEQEVQKTRDENALYLTKFLSNDEEDFSRLKMYITQDGDSLEVIAERYEVPVTQLLKVNQMEQEEVQEGQVLYIPVRPVNNQ